MSYSGDPIALWDEFEAVQMTLAAAEHRLDKALEADGNVEAEESEVADLRSRHEALRDQLRNSGMLDEPV